MRKTKNLVIVLKGLLLIFALCLFTATQSNAQSTFDENLTSQAVEFDGAFDLSDWNFFQRIGSIFASNTQAENGNDEIVTTDMTRQRPVRDTPEPSMEKRVMMSYGSPLIVTDDMSIRDGGN